MNGMKHVRYVQVVKNTGTDHYIEFPIFLFAQISNIILVEGQPIEAEVILNKARFRRSPAQTGYRALFQVFAAIGIYVALERR